MSKDTIYCYCRSSDGTGNMLGCDGPCDGWYHLRCIGIKKKESDRIDKWFCKNCLRDDPSLKISYKKDETPTPPIQLPDKKIAKIKLEPFGERRQESKATSNKNESSFSSISIPKAKPSVPAKQPSNKNNKKGRVNQRSRSKGGYRIQCANLDCVYEARTDSKYCSDECGIRLNKLRYETHFIPKWQILEKKHSEARNRRFTDLDNLETEKKQVEQSIKDLRSMRDKLEKNINIIREQAKKLASESANSKKIVDSDDEMDSQDIEEATTGDASKIFCITCGLVIPFDGAFKHWSTCHKKKEEVFRFTSDKKIELPRIEGDPDPKLYCHTQDKKTKRFCMNIMAACPQHSDWKIDKDEICGCPLKIMQDLIPDGNYCLEKRKDCTQHYNWDRFRLAQIDMQRLQAYTRLDQIVDSFYRTNLAVNDTYGGVVGVMLHKTVDHIVAKESPDNGSPYDQDDVCVNVDMVVD